MQLYKQINPLTWGLTSEFEVLDILKKSGAYSEFTPFISSDFVRFVFYFVHAYSFESEMMDTKCYSESLKVIEKNFDFNFDSFRQKIKEFDEKYQELIQWYLDVQNNRDFECLMSGQILYKQMISASTSRAILKKSKGEKLEDNGTENIDYGSKYEYFISALSLNEKLSVLEEKLSRSTMLINAVQEGGKKAINLKIEDY